MKYGLLKIFGVIGNITNELGEIIQKGITLIDLVDQVKKAGEVDEYVVVINSPGGSVDVGFAMNDYINSLKKPITTIAYKDCSSIATVVLLAGDPGKKLIVAGSKVLIHNPWTSASGNAAYFERVAEVIQQEEDKLLSFYSKSTGVNKEGIAPLMAAETDLSDEESVKLGFADKVITEQEMNAFGSVEAPQATRVKAVAIFNLKNKTMKKNEKTGESLLASIKALIDQVKGKKVPEAKALDYKTNDGKAVSIASDGSEPKVGDVVTVDGQPAPTATLTLEDGTVVETDADSKITAIESSSEEATEALAALVVEKDEEIEKMKADHAAAITALEKKHDDEIVKINGQVRELAKVVASKHTPAGSETKFRKGSESKVNPTKDAVTTAVENYRKKKKAGEATK